MAEMNDKDINKWWTKSFSKQNLNQSNKAKVRGDRWGTHNDLRDFAPAPKKGSSRNAHKR